MPIGTAKFQAGDTAEVKELFKKHIFVCMCFYLQCFQHCDVFVTCKEVLQGHGGMNSSQVLLAMSV